ncbi:MAG: hypothetical protein JNM51_00020 [Bacteroidia bacterium]|nr:hypothetical protein [Bacteroidia bacterium]
METVKDEFKFDARVYFLQQGQIINNLSDILDTNISTHSLNKWLSILIETVLYILFISILVGLFIIPDDPSFYFEVNNTTQVTAEIHSEEFATLMMCIKLVCNILSLPILAFAILLGRNRKKNDLIKQAYQESMKMKMNFDEILKSMPL